MSIWTRISAAISALSNGESLSGVFAHLRTAPERSVGFTIAVIALGAKMAKADGRVTRNEVAAFREVFHIPVNEEPNAARVFNLARQDVAGYEEYAKRINGMFRDDAARAALCDLLQGLFHIALADGSYDDREDAFLQRVAQIFGLTDRQFRAVRARHVQGAECDPWEVLGVAPDTDLDEAKRAWRQLVLESHPDRMIARGLPEEAICMAEKRLMSINRAWEEIRAGAAG